MGDALGGLRLPAPVPILDGKAQTKTRAPGDPGLAVLASYVATVLQNDLAAAWESFIPADPVLPDMIEAGRHGSGPVRTISFQDPRDMRRRQRSAVLADFPALYAFRVEPAKLEQVAEDYPIRTTTVLLLWVPRPPSDTSVFQNRDPFGNAISTSVCAAINYGQHPAWVIASDLDQPTALLGPTATSTAPATIAIPPQATPTAPARRALLTTAPAVGAYTVGSKVTITGLNSKGRPWSDTLTITNADGGEALHTVWPFSSFTRLDIEAQALTTGNFTLGLHESSEKKQGSMMERAAGFCRCFVTRTGLNKPIPIVIGSGDTATALLLDAYEIAVTVEERIEADLAAHGELFEGVDPSQFLPNGTLFSTDQFDVP